MPFFVQLKPHQRVLLGLLGTQIMGRQWRPSRSETGAVICSGGSSIEALEAVPHQLLGKKAFIGLLPLFHSWLRLYSFHASRHNNASSFDAYHAT